MRLGTVAFFFATRGQGRDPDFTPVADSENELRVWLLERGTDLDELDDEFAATVREEFTEQSPLYPGVPELSDEEPFQEQEPG